MPLLPLVGHDESRRRVLQAIDHGVLPQTLLLAGPVGIGKQRFALWVAARLVCQGTEGEPCGTCWPCRKVLNLAHPDVHWFVPIPRPKAGEPDKQVEEAEEALADLMAERRARPLWSPPDGMASHGVASARLLLRRVALTPVEARRKVFVVGDAERLIPQEANPEAANALLKVLEEPPNDTVFLLTSAEPRRLLPTIRSRSVMLRMGRLADAKVGGFLQAHLRPPLEADALKERVANAAGAIGAALAESGAASGARQAALAFVEAVLAGRGAPLEIALRQNPWQARGDFSGMLDALAEVFGDAARDRAGSAPSRPVSPALRSRASLDRLAAAVDRVQAAREAAQGNVNPQLLLATLSAELEEALCA